MFSYFGVTYFRASGGDHPIGNWIVLHLTARSMIATMRARQQQQDLHYPSAVRRQGMQLDQHGCQIFAVLNAVVANEILSTSGLPLEEFRSEQDFDTWPQTATNDPNDQQDKYDTNRTTDTHTRNILNLVVYIFDFVRCWCSGIARVYFERSSMWELMWDNTLTTFDFRIIRFAFEENRAS